MKIELSNTYPPKEEIKITYEDNKWDTSEIDFIRHIISLGLAFGYQKSSLINAMSDIVDEETE